jgi:hypothetical protein
VEKRDGRSIGLSGPMFEVWASPDPAKKLTMVARDEAERDAWVEVLERCIKYCKVGTVLHALC